MAATDERLRQRRADEPTIYSCGCSWMKVALGRCDIFDADGRERQAADENPQGGDLFGRPVREMCERCGAPITYCGGEHGGGAS